MPDRYTYPGTEILINIPGYTDPILWKKAETLAVAARQAELITSPIAGDFDLAHLQKIHAHLTQDMYTLGRRTARYRHRTGRYAAGALPAAVHPRRSRTHLRRPARDELPARPGC